MKQSFNIYKTIFFIISLSLTGYLYAEEIIIIEDIKFTGLKRTKESVALQIIRPVEMGNVFTEDSENIIIQELREAGIFNPEIEVETIIKDNKAFIEVTLKDRWTLIPVPIFSFSQNGSWMAGVLGIEGNFLGYNKTLGLGFFFGSEGWSLLSFYNDPIFLDTDIEFTAGLSLGLNEITDENVNEETIREYQTDRIGLGLGISYPFTEEFSLGGGWNYNRSVLREESAASTGIPDLNATGIDAEIKWKDYYYDIPYEYGSLAKIKAGWNWGFDGSDNYPTVQGTLKLGLNPVGKHLFSLTANGAWSDNIPVQQQFRLGGRPGSLILPMGRIAADEYVNSAAVYNLPLWSFPGGTLSIKGFYELGYYKSDLISRTLFHGPGTGIDIFINDLAIPAIQMNFAWNLESGNFQFSAGVGMGGGAAD